MTKPVTLGALFTLFILAALLYFSFGNRKFRCQVCMGYEGRKACRIASAATRESALRSATDNACAQMASGVTATMVCTASTPLSVQWLK